MSRIVPTPYLELNEPPLSVDELVEKLGTRFELSFPFIAEATHFEKPLSEEDIEDSFEWLVQDQGLATVTKEHRVIISYLNEPPTLNTGDKALVFIQAGIFDDHMISCEYQVVECVGENQFKSRNFWLDYLPERIDFVKELFLYVSRHQALPPVAATWSALELTQFLPTEERK